jgi:hypothetical protein
LVVEERKYSVASHEDHHAASADGQVVLPAPSAWPIVLAFGFTLVFTGLLTSVSVTLLGAILSLAGVIGWFRDVFPHEQIESVPIIPDHFIPYTGRKAVQQIAFTPGQARAWLPLETYPISAGLKGGIAGSVAMAFLACAFGVIKAGSIWYPINLLAAGIYSQSQQITTAHLMEFHASSFLLATLLHGIVSILVGLLYGAMLPMIPRHPIILGGLIAPALWSALIYTILGLLNPTMESRIDWKWFVASQIGFGIVAGLVVVRQSRIPTTENVPWAIRAGIEGPGTMRVRDDGEKRP